MIGKSVFDKSIYKNDLRDDLKINEIWNWVIVELIDSNNKNHNPTLWGVLLHDGKFILNGILYDKHEFKVLKDKTNENYKILFPKHKWIFYK